MRKVKFEVAVSTILKEDSRYQSDGYFFLREALDFTVKNLRPDELIEHRHVYGNELLDGTKDYALKELGCMALPVLESWGIESGRDVGEMVYNLIKVEAFGKSDDDQADDFEGWLTFEEAFQKPFQPTRPVLAPSVEISLDSLETPARGNKPATTSEA